jgi:hypothetical protein
LESKARDEYIKGVENKTNENGTIDDEEIHEEIENARRIRAVLEDCRTGGGVEFDDDVGSEDGDEWMDVDAGALDGELARRMGAFGMDDLMDGVDEDGEGGDGGIGERILDGMNGFLGVRSGVNGVLFPE